MPMSVTSDLMFRSHSCCNSKIYGKTVWRNSCQQIPEKDQSYVKVGRNNVCYVEVLKLWVRLWSIFHCNVNSEFTFDEQWMKKTSRDSTLDFFWFRSKIFFPKIWAAELRVRLICRCGLSAGFYGNRKDKIMSLMVMAAWASGFEYRHIFWPFHITVSNSMFYLS